MSSQDDLKRHAAERAVELVEDGMTLGLGTGSTARFVLEALAARREAGELGGIVGVPTSVATRQLAEELGLPLATLDTRPHLDMAIDGADEVDERLDVIKGLGGALLWEKIVASAADRFVIVVDSSKLVPKLGERKPLPVEVVPFGWPTHVAAVEALGAEPVLREAFGEPFRTDGGHFILDCAFPNGIDNPRTVDTTLRSRPGVVETGLFLGMATQVVVAGTDGVRVVERDDG